MDPWVQCLDAAVEHFGKARVIRDRRHGDAFRAQQSCRPAAGEDLDVECLKLSAQVDHAFLVEDADQRAFDPVFHHGPPEIDGSVAGSR